jgi:hypothetical protein
MSVVEENTKQGKNKSRYSLPHVERGFQAKDSRLLSSFSNFN